LRLHPRELLGNELIVTSQSLLLVLAAVAAVPGFVIAALEAGRRFRSPLLWGPLAAVASAVAFTVGARIAPTLSESATVEVFLPISVAVIGGLIPGFVVARLPTVSGRRRWRMARIVEGYGTEETILAVERDGLVLEDRHEKQEIPRDRLRGFDRSGATLLLRFVDADEVCRLIPIPDDGEDDTLLARAIHARVTSLLRRG
jgi:hypothetical protein